MRSQLQLYVQRTLASALERVERQQVCDGAVNALMVAPIPSDCAHTRIRCELGAWRSSRASCFLFSRCTRA